MRWLQIKFASDNGMEETLDLRVTGGGSNSAFLSRELIGCEINDSREKVEMRNGTCMAEAHFQ